MCQYIYTGLNLMSVQREERKANKIYDLLLDRIIKYHTLTNGTTYLSQLDEIGKHLLKDKFMGVYPSDKIPKLTKKQCYCILNLDNSSESGSHWVSLALDLKGNSMFYDSFGRDYKEIIPNLEYSKNGKVINTELDAEQGILQQDCGSRALAWLLLYEHWGAKVAKQI